MSNALKVTAPEGLPYVDFEREFDAPVSAVFNAHRDPALVAQWMGPDRYGTEIGEWDFTSGGRWSMTNIDGDTRYEFRGTFHTVRENELAIQTFEFLRVPDVVSIESLRFVEVGGGRTRLVGHAVYPSMEARDGMVAAGMEGGMSEGYDKLDALLDA
ncbi:SRPBCC family protein [Homoserinibacter sp. GY 40078]|uniref:SRPBCC family protein n=1 Tax=Homoserinibacter sp. GY 40078 TaxID=2603275 RepID=UPI0011C83B40|nr:SRPBCC family protein [Homoserinibacter sp. GY 40078]TXK18785.1 SRPBCC family protein [Homoserinibacter sp. GY 40078]